MNDDYQYRYWPHYFCDPRHIVATESHKPDSRSGGLAAAAGSEAALTRLPD